MGMFDGIISKLKGSKEEAPRENNFEKEQLARQVEELVRKINGLNSFDSSIRSLTNESYRDLQSMKSLEELQRLKFKLENKLLALDKEAKSENPEMKAIEKSKWTAEKMNDMTDKELDRLQRDEGR